MLDSTTAISDLRIQNKDCSRQITVIPTRHVSNVDGIFYLIELGVLVCNWGLILCVMHYISIL